MADRRSATLPKSLKRRSLLQCAVGLASGAAAAMLPSGSTCAQRRRDEVPEVGQPAAKSRGRLESPNYRPPVVEVQAGKLRGFRDGRSFASVDQLCPHG